MASLAALAASRLPAQTSELKDEVQVCRNDVIPEIMQQANASFVALYRLKTGRAGEVVTVTRLREFPWSNTDKALVDCLRHWRFPVADKEVTVQLSWKHGAGWTSISIGIPGMPWRTIRTPAYEPEGVSQLP
jgi:hypothetical protein